MSKRPVCPICNDKLRSDEYVWDYEKQMIVHKSCREIKSVIINLEPIRFGVRARR